MAGTAEKKSENSGGEKMEFQAEVGRLLDIVAHSMYSEREVFLRELCSNASDALDKLRYEAIKSPELTAEDPYLHIRIIPDEDKNTLTVLDNGIGMNRVDLVENLGTIARSGTAAFVENIARKGDEKKAATSLIGQFGVGFYAAFMVAEKVEVISRKAGEKEAWHWASDGKSGYEISPADDGEPADLAPARGTRIILHLKDDAKEFTHEQRIRHIVEKYADHIGMPIHFGAETDAPVINQASAFWMRGKDGLTDEQYTEFYRHVSHAHDEPWHVMHFKAEGMLEYTGLLFVPETRPFDLFDPRRAHGVKLYVRRVFITDHCEGLLPPYLRFLRGVVDSEDLPLNISREMLQNNPMVAKIRSQLTKRVLRELAQKAEADEENYLKFWANYGAVVKEGLYEDQARQEDIWKICRFRSSTQDGWVSLADYVSRMKEGQEQIHYITGEDPVNLANSPHLEAYVEQGIEVLLLTDPIDQLWLTMMPRYDGKTFKSVTQGAAELGEDKAKEDAEKQDGEETKHAATAEETPEEIKPLIAALNTLLGGQVKSVRASHRLTKSPVVLVADEGDLDINLQRILKQTGQVQADALRILEINPGHAMIRKLAERAKSGKADDLADEAWLLLDQARILDGEPLPDPAGFARRLSEVMSRAVD